MQKGAARRAAPFFAWGLARVRCSVRCRSRPRRPAVHWGCKERQAPVSQRRTRQTSDRLVAPAAIMLGGGFRVIRARKNPAPEHWIGSIKNGKTLGQGRNPRSPVGEGCFTDSQPANVHRRGLHAGKSSPQPAPTARALTSLRAALPLWRGPGPSGDRCRSIVMSDRIECARCRSVDGFPYMRSRNIDCHACSRG